MIKMRSSLRRPLKYDQTMPFLRHDLLRLTTALLAAFAVLFVSTASIACEAPVDQDMASMSMSGDGVPCEPKTVRISCHKACLAICQGLVPQGGESTHARVYASVLYPSLDARHADFTVEADDPPPRR